MEWTNTLQQDKNYLVNYFYTNSKTVLEFATFVTGNLKLRLQIHRQNKWLCYVYLVISKFPSLCFYSLQVPHIYRLVRYISVAGLSELHFLQIFNRCVMFAFSTVDIEGNILGQSLSQVGSGILLMII